MCAASRRAGPDAAIAIGESGASPKWEISAGCACRRPWEVGHWRARSGELTLTVRSQRSSRTTPCARLDAVPARPRCTTRHAQKPRWISTRRRRRLADAIAAVGSCSPGDAGTHPFPGRRSGHEHRYAGRGHLGWNSSRGHRRAPGNPLDSYEPNGARLADRYSEPPAPQPSSAPGRIRTRCARPYRAIETDAPTTPRPMISGLDLKYPSATDTLLVGASRPRPETADGTVRLYELLHRGRRFAARLRRRLGSLSKAGRPPSPHRGDPTTDRWAIRCRDIPGLGGAAHPPDGYVPGCPEGRGRPTTRLTIWFGHELDVPPTASEPLRKARPWADPEARDLPRTPVVAPRCPSGDMSLHCDMHSMIGRSTHPCGYRRRRCGAACAYYCTAAGCG